MRGRVFGGFDQAILPWAPRRDIGHLRSGRRDPFLNGLGNKLRPVVGANVAMNTTQDEQARRSINHISGLEPASDPDRQRFVGDSSTIVSK